MTAWTDGFWGLQNDLDMHQQLFSRYPAIGDFPRLWPELQPLAQMPAAMQHGASRMPYAHDSDSRPWHPGVWETFPGQLVPTPCSRSMLVSCLACSKPRQLHCLPCSRPPAQQSSTPHKAVCGSQHLDRLQ